MKANGEILEKKFNYVYITTNLINNKQYVGDHCCNDLEKDKYFGSGLILVESINKYGKENFKKEIMEFFSTKQEAFESQEKYIIKYKTLVPNGYNISPKGGHYSKGSVSELTKEKIRILKLNTSQETKEKIGKASRNRGKESNYRCGSTNRGKDTWMKGKNHTAKSKEENRLKHLGNHHSQESKDKISNATKGKNNPMFGRTPYDIWVEKYGKEEADIRHNNWKNKLKKK